MGRRRTYWNEELLSLYCRSLNLQYFVAAFVHGASKNIEILKIESTRGCRGYGNFHGEVNVYGDAAGITTGISVGFEHRKTQRSRQPRCPLLFRYVITFACFRLVLLPPAPEAPPNDVMPPNMLPPIAIDTGSIVDNTGWLVRHLIQVTRCLWDYRAPITLCAQSQIHNRPIIVNC